MERPLLILPVDDTLTLIEATEADAGVLFRAIDAWRDDLRRWLPFVDNLHTEADEAAFLSALCAVSPDLRNYTFKILSDGAFCGLVGFVSTDPVNRKTEVGYWVVASVAGAWHHVALCRGLCLWAFDVRTMNRVQIKCAVGNVPSNAHTPSAGAFGSKVWSGPVSMPVKAGITT